MDVLWKIVIDKKVQIAYKEKNQEGGIK